MQRTFIILKSELQKWSESGYTVISETFDTYTVAKTIADHPFETVTDEERDAT